MKRALQSLPLALLLLTGYSALAQEASLPDAPSRQFVSQPKVVSFTNPESHRFFDRQNKIAFGALAGLIALDAVTTQRLIGSGQAHEANPIWRPLVHHGWQGEMAASALGFSAALGMSYTLHKTGHHKLERWTNWLVVGVEAGNDAHNLSLDASR
jgi:hypothetical protein